MASSNNNVNDYIPYGKQWIDDDDIQSVIAVLKSDFITQGPKIEEFETHFAATVDSKYAVAFSSGTAALHAAVSVLGLQSDDEVITTVNTFCATSNAVLYAGARPIFSDIELDSYNMDLRLLESLITPQTRAIMPVHFAGYPCNLSDIMALAKAHNLRVIDDACHALGATLDGKPIGSITDMTCFSFHPVKHIATGEGGMVTTSCPLLYQKLVQFRTHGITRDSRYLYDTEKPAWYYEMQQLGFNYRMTDIQAALGVSQLKKLSFFLEKRQEIALYYQEQLADVSDIILPCFSRESNSQHAWHLFVIRVPYNRDACFQALREANIGVNLHYIPVYRHPFYKALGYDKIKYPNMELYYEACLSLPIFPGLSERDRKRVVSTVRAYFNT